MVRTRRLLRYIESVKAGSPKGPEDLQNFLQPTSLYSDDGGKAEDLCVFCLDNCNPGYRVMNMTNSDINVSGRVRICLDCYEEFKRKTIEVNKLIEERVKDFIETGSSTTHGGYAYCDGKEFDHKCYFCDYSFSKMRPIYKRLYFTFEDPSVKNYLEGAFHACQTCFADYMRAKRNLTYKPIKHMELCGNCGKLFRISAGLEEKRAHEHERTRKYWCQECLEDKGLLNKPLEISNNCRSCGQELWIDLTLGVYAEAYPEIEMQCKNCTFITATLADNWFAHALPYAGNKWYAMLEFVDEQNKSHIYYDSIMDDDVSYAEPWFAIYIAASIYEDLNKEQKEVI